MRDRDSRVRGRAARARSALVTAVALVAALLVLPSPAASAATAPGRPVTNALPGNGSISVTWTAPADGGSAITAYQVGTRRYSKTTKKWSAWTTVSASASARTKSVTATNGTTYQTRVRARNVVGWGSWSAAATVIAGTPRPPATIGAASGNGKATITWTSSTANGSAVKSYQLSSRSRTASTSWTTWKTVSYAAGARSSTITKPNGTTIEYRLRATNARGAGPWSTTRSTKAGLPARVGVVVTTPSAGAVGVSWTAPNGNGSAVTSYVVSSRTRASSSAAWGAWSATSTSSTSTSFTPLDPASQIQVTVAAVNAVGTGPASLPVTATVPDAATVWIAQSRPTTLGLSLSQGCMMVSAGVRCWGAGARGDGTDVGTYSGQVAVSGLGTVDAIAVGHAFACALKPDATVWCWGANNAGQVGNADYTDQAVVTTPVPVKGLPADALQVSAGMGVACSLLVTNEVYCWGSNSGILGESTLNEIVRTPVKITGLAKVVSIDVGWTVACAIVEEGDPVVSAAYCWGNNREGTVSPTESVGYAITTPLRMGTFSSVTSISTSESNTCLVDAGAVSCWGKGAYLGFANWYETLGIFAGPVQPLGATTGYTGVFVGAGGTCVLDTAGDPTCWGTLALGGSSQTPVKYTGFGQKVLELDPARETACARLEDGTVWCWGDAMLIDGNVGTKVVTPVKLPNS